MRIVPAILIAAAALAAATTQAQTVYRCTKPDGSVGFQDYPCEAGQKGGQIVVPPINSFEPFPALIERMAANAAGGMNDYDRVAVYGVPQRTNTDIINGVTYEQHVYRDGDGTRYVYSRNGLVVGEQYRPRSGRR